MVAHQLIFNKKPDSSFSNQVFCFVILTYGMSTMQSVDNLKTFKIYNLSFSTIDYLGLAYSNTALSTNTP
jgi:hypothetical protein